MEKLNKVIAGIEQDLKYRPRSCFGCPYDDGEDYCMDRLLTDALELLKEYRDGLKDCEDIHSDWYKRLSELDYNYHPEPDGEPWYHAHDVWGCIE